MHVEVDGRCSPSRFAMSSLDAGAPITTTSPAPDRLATKVAARPTGPAPWTSTLSPKRIWPRRSMACSTVGIAQPKAMTASDGVSSGTLKKVIPFGRSAKSVYVANGVSRGSRNRPGDWLGHRDVSSKTVHA